MAPVEAVPSATLGERLIAAHDDCRALMRTEPYMNRVQISTQLKRIASQYNLTRDQVSEILARAMDTYQLNDSYDPSLDYTKARA